MFKLNESIPTYMKNAHKVGVRKKLVNLDSHTVELLFYRDNEQAVTWDDTVVAILADEDTATLVFNHYCLKAMALYPHSSFRIVDLEQ